VANKRLRIGLVTPAVDGVSGIFISNLVKILLTLAEDVDLVTANARPDAFDKARVFSVGQVTGSNLFSRVFSYIAVQLKTAFVLARLAGKADFFIFFLCEENFLPMLTAKALRKKVVLALGGNTDLELRMQKNVFHRIMRLMREIDFSLSDKILVYSSNVIPDWNLKKHKAKIAIAHEHFLDFSRFNLQKPLDKRENLVGYVGRLSEEKGILNLAEAAPQILNIVNDLKFEFIGEGRLKNTIEQFLKRADLSSKVRLSGWIAHDKIPDRLNDFRLLVLPSYTEGLPNIMLEAMACGTPVLTTAVGSISQFIQDGQTGFIMENNSPECIAKNVNRAVNDPELEKIALNGKILVENEFNFEKAVTGYRAVADSIQPERRDKAIVENQTT
jgi:glycosyltransferase involved in cell wall biosynthesis